VEPIETENLGIVIGEPHEKSFLTTHLGRKIERLSLGDLLVIALLALVIAAEYFYITTPYGHGMNVGDRTWSLGLAGESIYFSAITFTTLGYGDISPIGFGRVVAMLLVFGGLAVVSLTIGKIASERQETQLLLLHTSDCQRRISGYVDDLEEYIVDLERAIANKDSGLAKTRLKELKVLVEAISNYVAFHLYQSNLIAFGNDTAISRLLSKMDDVIGVLSDTFKTPGLGEPIGSRCLSISKRIAGFEELVIKFHEKKIKDSQVGIGWKYSFYRFQLAIRLAKEVSAAKIPTRIYQLSVKNKELQEWSKIRESEWLIERVKELLPAEPRTQWERHQQKRIASELNISNNLAEACITTLIQRGVC
jgi:hypothetical protein